MKVFERFSGWLKWWLGIGAVVSVVAGLHESTCSKVSFDATLFFGAASAIGEILIVIEIYVETEHARLERFVGEAFSTEHYGNRRYIYTYLFEPRQGEKGSLETFWAAVRDPTTILEVEDEKEGTTDLRLGTLCDQQINLLNRLGLLLPNSDEAAELFPHVTIWMWLLAAPYLKNRTEDVGPWWCRPMGRLTLRTTSYAISHMEKSERPAITLRQPGGTSYLVFPLKELKTFRAGIESYLDKGVIVDPPTLAIFHPEN